MKTTQFYSKIIRTGLLFTFSGMVCLSLLTPVGVHAQGDNPAPPDETVRLIFIHHSCGENWLSDGNGDLGRVLGENNYFVSDTNYGWGPDSIGDRTDIPNWLEWFRGPESERYLAALYAESERLSAYTNHQSNPGGENSIIMFKSCFPNSNLEGNPDDPPAPGDGLSVGNAKYIYSELLQYFAARPDKLFIAITAPPVQDPSYAANARGFNTWLVQDWLNENGYTQTNVAVWDFYNVLTGPDNHHRFQDGAVEYITNQGGNTLYYPSNGDDHPSREGNQKATSEFVTMLNVFYNRWRENAPGQPAAEAPTPTSISAEDLSPASDEEQPASEPPLTLDAGMIDDFETDAIPGTEGWQVYWDQSTDTTITCSPDASMAHSPSQSLHIDFNVAADSWATCILLFNAPQDWHETAGISFYYRASQPSLLFNIDAHGGSTEALTTYHSTIETTQESVDGWVHLEIPWEQILRVDWEAEAGSPFDPAVVQGIAFGFNTSSAAPNSGEIWIDDLQLISSAAQVEAAPTDEAAEAPMEASPTEDAAAPPIEATDESKAAEEPESGGGGFCPGSMVLGIFVFAGLVLLNKKE
jgi:hypothetical protein